MKITGLTFSNFAILMSSMQIARCYIPPEYIIQQGEHGHCGETIFTEASAVIRSQPNAGLYGGLTFYHANQDCALNFKVPVDSQILVSFPYFEIEPPVNGTCNDDITITEIGEPSTNGSYDNTTVFCTTLTYTSGTDQLQIRFKTDGQVQRKGFVMLLTSFRTHNCTDTSFSCDTNRCISRSLLCDGHENCIDKSDENRELAMCPPQGLDNSGVFSLGKYTILAIASLLTAVLFVGFVVVIIWKNKNDRKHSTGDGDGGGSHSLTREERSKTRTITRGYSDTLARQMRNSAKGGPGTDTRKKTTNKIMVQPTSSVAKW